MAGQRLCLTCPCVSGLKVSSGEHHTVLCNVTSLRPVGAFPRSVDVLKSSDLGPSAAFATSFLGPKRSRETRLLVCESRRHNSTSWRPPRLLVNTDSSRDSVRFVHSRPQRPEKHKHEGALCNYGARAVAALLPGESGLLPHEKCFNVAFTWEATRGAEWRTNTKLFFKHKLFI